MTSGVLSLLKLKPAVLTMSSGMMLLSINVRGFGGDRAGQQGARGGAVRKDLPVYNISKINNIIGFYMTHLHLARPTKVAEVTVACIGQEAVRVVVVDSLEPGVRVLQNLRSQHTGFHPPRRRHD